MVYVTTSWDDGDALDKKLAALLERYGVNGTFYITKNYRTQRLLEDEIRALSETHEIGAHTLTHPNLTTIGHAQKKEEILGSKQWLEGVLGKEVPMFCYPAGHFDPESVRVVQESGFRGARTTEGGITAVPKNAFRMGTTIQIYPFPFRKKAGGRFYWRYLLQPFFQRFSLFRKLGVPFNAMYSPSSIACTAFDHVPEGGVFHLWGHSWELEEYGLWDELEKILAHIANRTNCKYITNGELLKILP